MSTQTKAKSSNQAAKIARPATQQALLAGIGAVSLLRRNAGRTLAEAGTIAGRLPEAANHAVKNAGTRATATIKEIGARGNAFRWEFERLAKALGRQAVNAGTEVIADVESRILPLLRKFDGSPLAFGVVFAKPRPAARPVRKATKKPAKRTVRKARKVA